jgi:hypothetical protein
VTASAADQEGGSIFGRGGGLRRWEALYAIAEVEEVVRNCQYDV